MQVFLHRGELHIIPREAELSADDDGSTSPALCAAVSYVCTHHSVTVASALIQQVLQCRISGYHIS